MTDASQEYKSSPDPFRSEASSGLVSSDENQRSARNKRESYTVLFLVYLQFSSELTRPDDASDLDGSGDNLYFALASLTPECLGNSK